MNEATHNFPTAALIDGEWIQGDKTFAVTNPATGDKIADVADLGAEHARQAIDAAAKALPAWAAKTAKERGQILEEWLRLINAQADSLAALMTAEQGKPLAEARGEIAYGASFIDWFAEEGKRAYGHTIPTNVPSRRYLTIKQPIGVVAAITPWNFPNAMITRKAASALAAGCTFVVKPAEDTPLSAIALAKLAMDAGIPAGVFNVVTGQDAAAIGDVFCADERVRKLTFTGSTEVGRLLYRKSADTIKKLTLELGGNAPFVIFNDANLERAVAGVMTSKFRNAGQTCVCANRILVQSGIHDRFVEAVTEEVKKLTVGPGAKKGTDVGPLINSDGIAKVKSLVEDASANGAHIVVGGSGNDAGALFYTPTIVTGVKPDMRIAREEIFGPVLSIIPFDTDEEGIRLANDTPFGLASYLFSENISRAWKAAEAIESGIVAINDGMFSNEAAPFGGYKQSGLGREGAAEGLDEYLETKFICIGGL